ncbi:MAG: type II toxin-antitoxin system HicA family toxin [Oscillospiraceae bacterium]|nr:type II toxin-antitoxin system HicA family toxin [Oscillospiraceae bacterium]
MAEYEKKVRNILHQNGCYFSRHGKGDHDIWYSPITNCNVTVDGKIKSRYTANEILKKSGINYRF